MYKVGDLVKLDCDSLREQGYTCDQQTVFQILKISYKTPRGSNRSFLSPVGYYIDAIIDGRHIIKCDASEANCVVGWGLIILYEGQTVGRKSIECIL